MSIQFKMVPKKNNLVAPPQTNYYPCAVHNGEITLDDLATTVASQSTLSRADCYAVIIAMTQVVGDTLTQGKIVRIDNLGTFQITLQGTPAATPDDLGKANIKKANLVFRPAAYLKNVMKKLTYKRLR
jgi:predicted histone-like DNA-binding protein